MPGNCIACAAMHGVRPWSDQVHRYLLCRQHGEFCRYAYGSVHQTTGDISLCGYYSGSSAFGGTVLNSEGDASQAFLMRLDSAGAVKWVREIQGAGVQRAFGTAVDSEGNSYVIGNRRVPP